MRVESGFELKKVLLLTTLLQQYTVDMVPHFCFLTELQLFSGNYPTVAPQMDPNYSRSNMMLPFSFWE